MKRSRLPPPPPPPPPLLRRRRSSLNLPPPPRSATTSRMCRPVEVVVQAPAAPTITATTVEPPKADYKIAPLVPLAPPAPLRHHHQAHAL